MKYPLNEKLKTIELCEKGLSLYEISRETGIPVVSVWRWLKKYREHGIKGLNYSYNNKFDLEKFVVDIKQKNPKITIEKAQEILNNKGERISKKKIWKIWRKYGFTGFERKRDILFVYGDYFPVEKDIRENLEITKFLFEKGEIKKCAEILNSITFCPRGTILSQIPDRYLSLERKIDKCYDLYGVISYKNFVKKLRNLRKTAFEKGKIYWALRAGFLEIKTLEWLWDGKGILKVAEEIEKYIKNIREKPLLFGFYVGKGKGYGIIGNYHKGMECARKCEKMLYNSRYNIFYRILLSSLYTFLENNKKSWYHIEKIKDKFLGSRDFLYAPIIVYTLSGEFKKVNKFVKKAKEMGEDIGANTGILLARAMESLSKGNLKKVNHFASEALRKAKEAGIKGYIYSVNLILAGIYSILGMRRKKDRVLQNTLKLMEKYKIHHYIELLKMLMRNKKVKRMPKNTYSRLKLYFLLQKAFMNPNKGNIKNLFYFVENQKIKGIFHRDILLFPEIVVKALRYKMKLPFSKNFLKLSCFQKGIPVFYIKFLGPLKIYKNNKYLPLELSPRESSFLIFLANMKEKKYLKTKIMENYWKNKKHPHQYLYNMLFCLKKKLCIPSHMLYFKKDYLYNKVNFYTDWDEFQNHIVNAHALLKMGEKNFAKRVFLNALRLIRGKPFEKMYDTWSEDMRDKILAIIREEMKNYKKISKNEKKLILPEL